MTDLTVKSPPRGMWAAYGAAVWAGIFAAISLYWALGGMIGIDTVGGELADLARSGGAKAELLAWGVTVTKAAGVVFALALVRHWGRIFPRRLLLAAGWAGTALLVLYGGVLVGVELLVAVGIIDGASDMDYYAFYWHLALWDPYFLVWGVLLGIAVRQFQVATRP